LEFKIGKDYFISNNKSWQPAKKSLAVKLADISYSA